jgi:hypothetical protein
LLDCEDLVEATLNAIGSQKDIFYEEELKVWNTSSITEPHQIRIQIEEYPN